MKKAYLMIAGALFPAFFSSLLIDSFVKVDSEKDVEDIKKIAFLIGAIIGGFTTAKFLKNE